MRGSALLEGNDTTPGCHLTDEEKRVFSEALVECKKYGLDFYPTIIQKVRYDEMSEIAAYGGFPHRYPHWYWGMQYEELQRGYEYNQHRIYELVVNCTISGTKLLTSLGTKLVEDIRVGDIVLSRDGSRKVVFVKKQSKAKVLRVTLHDHHVGFTCTPNHKWWTLRDSYAEWIETKDLRCGDYILGGGKFDNFLNHAPQITWDEQKVLKETAPNVRWKLKDIKTPKQITVQLAELLGICTGDGSCGVPCAENLIIVSIDKKQVGYQQHVSGLFFNVFNVAAKIDEKPNCCTVTMSSKYAVDFMNSIGLKKGVTYDNKRIPDIIWQSSNEFRAAYMRGLFDTDGYAGTYLSFSAKNENLGKDVQLMLLEMGIRSRLSHVLNKNNDIWVLSIKGRPNVVEFNNRIGFNLDYKKIRLEALVNAGNPSRGDYKIPGIQKLILKLVNELENPKRLPKWIRSFRHRLAEIEYNTNSLWMSLSKLLACGYEQFREVFGLLSTPMYEVQSVEEAGEQETYDIALDHDAHDFLANGLISHNTNPCVMYIMASNTMLDNVTVVFHATGHNDFFKNNIFFTPTDENMMNKLSSNAARIRKYITRWGRERVTEFIDHILRIQTLIDPAKAWTERVIREPVIKDKREYEYPRRLRIAPDRLHMDSWINPKSFIDKEYKKIEENELAKELELFQISDKDIFGFLKDYAHLKPWQQDIISMLYEESMYFSPQRATKTLNEGWASMMDYEFMTRQGFCALGQKNHDMGIVEYAVHKMGVLGGKYSVNPYKTGFYLLLDIEERWNKGQFGTEYEECKYMKQKEDWDTKAGLGKQKIFEVRKYYNDVTFINEFFTQEFCNKFEYFEYKHYPNGEWKIEGRDAKVIKRKLLQKHVNGGLPDIRIVDPNHRNKNYFLLQHYRNELDDRVLYDPYARSVMTSIYYLWGKDVMLATTDRNNDEFVYVCVGTNPEKDVVLLSREDYEKTWT